MTELEQLRRENELLKQRIAILEASRQAKMAEMDCEAYNL